MIDELKDRLFNLNELRLSLINVLQLKGSSITNEAKLSEISEKIDEAKEDLTKIEGEISCHADEN